MSKFSGLAKRTNTTSSNIGDTDGTATSSPAADELLRARDLSRAKQFKQAVDIYTPLFQAGSLGVDNHTNYGWDLHRMIKDVLSTSGNEELLPGAVREAKQYLSIYMKLSVERPSLLHTVMLQHALKLGAASHLKMMVFAQMWGLENLRTDDFDRYLAPDGKQYPSLAEKVIQQASKEAAAEAQPDQLNYILPFVENGIVRFQDNVWLKYNLVKLLRALGRSDDARAKAVDFAKTKANESWTWDLLASLQDEPAVRLACYCKALLCSQNDEYVSKIRLKAADALAEAGYFAEAKGEIMQVIEYKQKEGQRLPAEATRLTQQPWYPQASSAKPQMSFYARFAPQAEELLFSSLPWIDACAGERFVGQDGKQRRKIYVRSEPLSIEFSVPDSRFPMRNLRPGAPIKIRADFDPKLPSKLTLHAAQEREGGGMFDVLTEVVGVVDHVNVEKGVFHCIAGKEAHGIFPIADYAAQVVPGDSLNLKFAISHSKSGKRIHIISAEPSSVEAGWQVRKSFMDKVRLSNGMGFTSDNIFVAPYLVQAGALQDGDQVSGIAALSFNEKRSSWGWKAVKIDLP